MSSAHFKQKVCGVLCYWELCDPMNPEAQHGGGGVIRATILLENAEMYPIFCSKILR